MPVAAKCPSCSAPLSETSVLALAPVCLHCGSVITEVGGTLGLTGAYGVNDPTITRQRAAADLAVFQNHLNNSRGMFESCKEQLTWGVERYARFPREPELLALQDVPPFILSLFKGIGFAIVWFIGSFIAIMVVELIREMLFGRHGLGEQLLNIGGTLVLLGGTVVAALVPPARYFSATAANGQRPQENARRQRAYQEAVAAALRAAEPVKAATDHRLRVQIRELESLIKTLSEKQENVRRILATL